MSDYYELAARLSHSLEGKALRDRAWNMSPGAELHILLMVASTLHLSKAHRLLLPMIEARTDELGNCIPDSEL